MLAAIEDGIYTSSTKQRLEELEANKEDLEIAIVQEKIEKPLLTKEQIVFWISRFKNGNIDDEKYRQDIIDIFVNSVYLYDDKLVLMFNYKDGSKTITLAEIEGSDLGASAPPKP
ncbi:hypothetical protein LJC56_10445 [Christensenellaceae bacterium OttesenSCG-928-K19]|nr:hypothetical protein [Christensenellaceae bacterium OttesenSCG-928-K19]